MAASEHPDDPELLSRLRVIEEQPLETRADAYASLHDELSRRLGSGPTEPSR